MSVENVSINFNVRGSDSLRRVSSQLTGIDSQIKNVGSSVKGVGKTMSMGLSLPILGLATASVKSTAEYNAQMSKVQAISGATGKDMAKLNKKAKEMGATTKFSATESGKAFEYMAMAGWETEDMLNGIEGVMNLAAASGEDLGTVSDIVTDALTAFKLEASDAGDFADLLASASSSANTNVGMLGESFKYAAPVAAALKFSVQDVTENLALMANAGIKASQSGTAMRMGMNRLAKPTTEGATLMEQMGIKTKDAAGEMLPLDNIVENLRGSFKGLTGAQQAEAASTIFGVNAMAGWLSVINASEKDIKKVAKATTDYSGKAKEMSDIMQNNLMGQITILKSQLSGLGMQIGNILLPYVKKAVVFLQGLSIEFGRLSPKTKKIIVFVGLLVAGIGPLLVAIGTLISLAGTASTVFSAIAAVLGAVVSPIGIIVAAAVGLGVAFGVLLVKAGVLTKIGELITFLKTAFMQVYAVAKPFLIDTMNQAIPILNEIKVAALEFASAIVEHMGEGLNRLKDIWDKFFPSLVPIIKGTFDTLKYTIILGLDVIKGVIKIATGIITGNWNKVWEGFSDIVSGNVEYIKGVIMPFIKWTSDKIKGLLDLLGKFAKKIPMVQGLSGIGKLIPKFAGGTDFAPGGLSLVGERGPELVNLPRGSQVFNAQKTKGMLSNTTVNNNFQNSTKHDVSGTIHVKTPNGDFNMNAKTVEKIVATQINQSMNRFKV